MNNSNRHWADIQESGFAFSVHIMLGCYRLLGPRLFTLLMYPVLVFFFAFNHGARRASRDYLTRLAAVAPETGVRPTRAATFRHLAAFTQCMVDKLSAWLGAAAPDDVEFHGRELLARQLARGSGAVVLGSHLGNLEICRALADYRSDLRLNILVHTRHADRFNRVLQGLSAHRRFELIEVTELDPGVAMALAERVQRGELLVIFADRTPLGPSPRQVRVPFLGSPAAFPQGPFILAALLKCPVYLMFGLRREGRYHIHIEHFAEQLELPRRRREEALREAAARFAARLEHYCRLAPLQWFNFYAFWGDAPRPEPTRQENAA